MSPLTFISADPFATPARPADRGPILLGLIVLGLFIGGVGIWGSLAPLSSAAIAPGQVKVEGHRKTVHHLEGGIIREILVREGDEVHEGQLLLRLDDTQSHATLELGRGERNALKALEARLTAERDDLAAIPFPAD